MHTTYIDEKNQELAFWCPGCEESHRISYAPGRWLWNQDRDKPTFSPSVLSNPGLECPNVPLCHSFVEGGKIRFLTDSTHPLAGQTVELKPW